MAWRSASARLRAVTSVSTETNLMTSIVEAVVPVDPR